MVSISTQKMINVHPTHLEYPPIDIHIYPIDHIIQPADCIVYIQPTDHTLTTTSNKPTLYSPHSPPHPTCLLSIQPIDRHVHHHILPADCISIPLTTTSTRRPTTRSLFMDGIREDMNVLLVYMQPRGARHRRNISPVDCRSEYNNQNDDNNDQSVCKSEQYLRAINQKRIWYKCMELSAACLARQTNDPQITTTPMTTPWLPSHDSQLSKGLG